MLKIDEIWKAITNFHTLMIRIMMDGEPLLHRDLYYEDFSCSFEI